MAKLKQSKALPKARAPQAKKGNLSPAEKARIVAKADRMLKGSV